MKLPPLLEGVIILAIFRLAIKVLPDLINIPTKRQIASQLSQGYCMESNVMLKPRFRGWHIQLLQYSGIRHSFLFQSLT